MESSRFPARTYIPFDALCLSRIYSLDSETDLNEKRFNDSMGHCQNTVNIQQSILQFYTFCLSIESKKMATDLETYFQY